MSSSSRTTKRKAISYAEVDSDAEDSEQDQEVVHSKEGKRGKGDTYGATSKSRRKKRKIKSDEPQRPEEPVGSSKLLLEVPYDLFVEILSHLEGPDVIALGKVNKALHGWIVTAAESDSIWGGILRRDNLQIPSDMSTLAFAIFIYGTTCQACGENAHNRRNFYLRTRHCWSCEQQTLISDSSIARSWKKLHPRAIECVRFYDSYQGARWPGQRPSNVYVVRELEEVHHELCELEAEDENNLDGSFDSSGLYSRSRQGRPTAPATRQSTASRLSLFVRERREWVTEEQRVSSLISTACTDLYRTRMESRAQEFAAKREQFSRFSNRLVQDYGWTEAEASQHIICHKSVDFGSDAEAWDDQRKIVQNEISKRARGDQLRVDRFARRGLVLERWDSLRTESTSVGYKIFPGRGDFADLPSVRLLWFPRTATVDDAVWEEALPQIKEEIQSMYLEEVRVQTARALVAARNDTDFSQTSNEATDYPISSFGPDFFSLATSLFTDHRIWRRHIPLQVWQYPKTSEMNFKISSSYQYYTNFRQVYLISSILEAAGLDPNFATLGDLESLEGEWIWTNHPKKSKRRDTFDWLSLLDEALIEAPTAPKLRSGKYVRFKYSPFGSEEE